MKKVIIGILLCGGFLFLDSCKDDPTCTTSVPESKVAAVNQTQLAKDIGLIDNFLVSKSIIAQNEPNGTRYVITSSGTGEKIPCLESRITIAYSVRIMGSGTILESSPNSTFTLSGLILGWQLVLPLVPGGSKVTLYVPSGYAYGTSVSGKIPANANLIFEIELL